MQDYARACPLIVSSNNMLSPATRQVATQEYAAKVAFPAKKPRPVFFFLLANDPAAIFAFCTYLMGHLSDLYGRGDICAEYHMA